MCKTIVSSTPNDSNYWWRNIDTGSCSDGAGFQVNVCCTDNPSECDVSPSFTITCCECQSNAECNDGNPCTDNWCDCTCQTSNNSASCNDGQFCNGIDMCSGGTCSAHSGNPCTGGPECADSCNEAADNCFDPAGTACTDEGNPCTNDQCNGAGSCTHPANNASCDDGLFCNGSDTCSGGSCSVHAGNPCAGGPECADSCSEAADNCFDQAGTACTDDGEQCTDDECDGSGSCGHPVKADGTACDDGNPDTCPDECAGGVCASSPCEFTIGGAIYAELGDPLGSGEEGVTVCATCDGGFNDCAVTSGGQGLWQINSVPPGPCEITADKTGCVFMHVVSGVPGDRPPISITVDADHQAENQSIQFLAECGGACCLQNGGCLPDQTQDFCISTLQGHYGGGGTDCTQDLCVGACCIHDLDVCVPSQTASDCNTGGEWAGLLTECFEDICPLCYDGDANRDTFVDLLDFAWFQVCYGNGGTGDCKCLDMDNDNDVDRDDYLRFHERLTGP